MPATSEQQAKFFRWLAHDPKAKSEKGNSLGYISDAGILITDFISPNISTTAEGYLLCENAVIARTGTQDYTSAELNIPSLTGALKLIRSPEEVFRPESIASFEGVPITLRHPPVMVNSSNWKNYAIGTVHNVRQEDDLLKADLLITDSNAVNQVQMNGLKNLSCGYFSTIKILGNGIAEQTQISGNHVALVTNPRAGDIASIIDSNSKGKTMSKKTILQNKFFSWLLDEKSEIEELVDAVKEEEKKVEDSAAHEKEEDKQEADIMGLVNELKSRIEALEKLNTAVEDSKDESEDVTDCKDSEEENEVKDEKKDEEDADGEYAVGDAWNTFISKTEILIPGKRFKTPVMDSEGNKPSLTEYKREVLSQLDPTFIKSITTSDINKLNNQAVSILFDSAVTVKGKSQNFRPTFIEESKGYDPLAKFVEAHNKANRV